MKKYKYADKRNDKIILKNEFKMKHINNEIFKGTISLIDIKEVKNAVSVTRPDTSEDCVLDTNYKWLGIYPDGDKKYCITVMYDQDWNLLQWYWDIARGIYKEDGVPYIDDLYLDIVVLPNGKHYMIDEDELEEALLQKDITEEEYRMAYDMGKKISKNLDSKFKELTEFTTYCLEILR